MPSHRSIALSSSTRRLSFLRQHSASPPTQGFVCEWSPPLFRFSWCFITSFHVFHAAALARAMYAQVRTVRNPGETMASFRGAGSRLRIEYYYAGAGVGVFFILYHLYSITLLIWHSVRARELALADPRVALSQAQRTGTAHSTLHRFKVAATTKFTKASRMCQRLVDLYGIRGPYFEATFHAKEVYEVFWETVQLYQNTHNIVDATAGYVALAILVVNCWTTPLIYRLFQHPNHRATRVVLCLLVDVLLDFSSAMVLPYVLYVNYRIMITHPKRYDAIWTFLVGSDLIHFSTNSIMGILAKVVPSLSMGTNLSAIKPVLRRRPRQTRPPSGSTLSKTAPATCTTTTIASATLGIVPAHHHPQQFDGPVASIVPPPLQSAQFVATSRTGYPRWVVGLHYSMLLYALVATLFIVLGARDPTKEGLPECRVIMSHWTTRLVPCAVLHIDCKVSGVGTTDTTSTSEDLAVILRRVNTKSLRTITFSNCEALTMPQEIQQFPNLIWLEVHQSVLVDWPLTSALTQQTSPHLSHVLFLQSNLSTGFPAALAIEDFPKSLLKLTFADTNLTDLPLGVEKVWPQPMAALVFERCQLTSVPEALGSVHTDVLSLAGNNISVVPASLLDGKSYALLSLSSNPIQELPRELPAGVWLNASKGAATDAHGLWIVDTKITTLPHWITTHGHTSLCLIADVYAFQSPLCGPPSSSSTSSSGSSLSLQMQCDPTGALTTTASVLACDPLSKAVVATVGITSTGFLTSV